MTSENDLVLAIKDTLDGDGTLGKIKAEVRAKIMEILNNQSNNEKPALSDETLLVNELIREHLNWNGYKYSKSVFVQESGLGKEPHARAQLLEELGVLDSEDSIKVSVLHGIISTFKENYMKNTCKDNYLEMPDTI